MIADKEHDWRTIAVLNAVSTFAQFGQYGIGFVVLPLWLIERGLNAAQLGMFASFEWFGMLIGVIVTPWFNKKLGHRTTINLGLLLGMACLVLIPLIAWPVWLMAASLLGFGLGLRWIGLEPWLYQIAPDNAVGRLVGFHETLMGIAAIFAPILARWYGVSGNTPFVMGVAFSGLAILTLTMARRAPEMNAQSSGQTESASNKNRYILKLGVLVALVGGLSDGAAFGLFPAFALGRGFNTEQIETLLAICISGGVLLQYLLGWLTDHRGIIFAVSVCAISTLAVSIGAAFASGFAGLAIELFVLGGGTAGYLTLAIVTATQSDNGNLSTNIKHISIAFTAGSIFGPLIAGMVMETLSSEALIWQIGALAAMLFAYVMLTRHRYREISSVASL